MKKIGIVAESLAHSLSPDIHNYWIKKNKLDVEYQSIEIKEKQLNQFFKKFVDDKNFLGFNITVPYKEKFFKICPNISDKGKDIGSINLIYKSKNKIFGENTDYIGFKKTYEKTIKSKINKVLVIGSGGAARAILKYLSDKGIYEIDIYSKSFKKRRAINKGFKINNYFIDSSHLISKKYNLIVNASTGGMTNHSKFNSQIINLVKSTDYLIDIVYNPIKTALIKEAIKAKISYSGGLTMLLEQAKPSFELWLPGNKAKISSYLYNKVKKKLND